MPRCSRVNIQHVVADDFDFVRKQFDERVPAVLFQSKHCGDATVSVGISQGETFGSSTWTCDLLRTYCRIDERVALLAIAFRYWAKVRTYFNTCKRKVRSIQCCLCLYFLGTAL